MNNLKARLQKLEAKNSNSENAIVIFIDDICTYDGKQYTKEEFYKLYPDFEDGIFIEIE